MSNGNMSYNTWAQGYAAASHDTDFAIRLEHRSNPDLTNLRDRVFPAYLRAAGQWSALLASGLSPPSSAYAYQAASTSNGLSAGVTEIGDKAEAKKKWRLCLDRGKLIKGRIKELGGEIGKAGAGIVNAQRSSNAEPFLTSNGGSTTLQPTGTTLKQKLPADVTLVLRRSSSINGSILPPWDDTLAPHWNHDYQQQVGPSKQYGRLPELSPDQAAYQPKWKPMEQPNSADQPQSDDYQPNVHDVKVEQGIGANCSVVVGLELCLKHNLKWGTKLVEENMEALNWQLSDPDKGAHDKRWHKMRLSVNGSWRAILLDNTLPTIDNPDLSMHARVVRGLHMSGDPELDAENEDEPIDPKLQHIIRKANVWIPLAEKAYMTLHSGYHFPGSIPSLDLYTLTNWIPERLQFTSPEFKRERTWRRLLEGFKRGTCLVALGTGRTVRGGAGLAPLHAYAASELWEETDGRRRIRVDNPWKLGRQAGIIAQNVTASWTNDLRQTLIEEEQSPHTYTFSWDELCNRFETLEINWSPEIFANRCEVHAELASSAKHHAPPSYQLHLDSQSTETEVWILLLRHYVPNEAEMKNKPPIALHVTEEDDMLDSASWKIEDADQVDFLDSPFVLVKHTCSREKALLQVIPIIEALPGETIRYSIFAFSDANITLSKTAKELPFEVSRSGSFMGQSAGGASSYPTYMNNPQYALEIKSLAGRGADQEALLRLTATCGSARLPIGGKVAWSDGKRVTDLLERDIILDSGQYRKGIARAEKDRIRPGVYTVIISTFEPGKTGTFDLSLESTLPISLATIPQEGAGMHQRLMTGAWSEANAAGRPSAGGYELNPTFEMLVSKPTVLFARLQLAGTSSTPINLTIFKRETGSKLGEQVVSSGPYNDATSGVLLPSTRFQPGIYLLVASTYAPGYWGSFKLNVFANGAVDVALVQNK